MHGLNELLLLSASEEELVALTKKTMGGVDACMDFVGLGTTVERAVKCANKVHMLYFFIAAPAAQVAKPMLFKWAGQL